MQKIKPSCNPDGWPAGRPMKTKEVKLDSSFFEYDTFKVEKAMRAILTFILEEKTINILYTRLTFLFLILIIIKKLKKCAIN